MRVWVYQETKTFLTHIGEGGDKMQSLTTSPFRELLDAQQQFSKMLDRSWGMLPSFTDMSPVDMYTEKGNLITEIALPDFKKEEIEVTATAEGLEINAVHQEKKEEQQERRYLLHESSQSYWRRISLPAEADTDKVDCTLKDGKLKIVMPLKNQPAAKQISIK